MLINPNEHTITKSKLEGARDRAADLIEQGWTRGAYARDEYDGYASVSSNRAVCWCASGALGQAAYDMFWASSDKGRQSYILLYDAWHEANPGKEIVPFNDDEKTTKQNVIDSIKRIHFEIEEEDLL